MDPFIQGYGAVVRFRALEIDELNFITETLLQTNIPLNYTDRDTFTLSYLKRMFTFSQQLEIVTILNRAILCLRF